jgi:hypothetical protein
VFERLSKSKSSVSSLQDINSQRKANLEALYNENKIKTVRDLIKIQENYSTITTNSSGSGLNIMIRGQGQKDRKREFLVAKMEDEEWFNSFK